MRIASLVIVMALAGLSACVWLSRDHTPTGEYARYRIPDLDEPSGLVRSRLNPKVFWTHNDSGDSARLFATTIDGRLLGEFGVDGAEATDWESITSDGAGHLYIADAGNNKNARQDLTIYRVKEPRVSVSVPPARGTISVDERTRFHFPEQQGFPDPSVMNFDVEATFWEPGDSGGGTLHLLTKHRSDQRTVLYRFDRLGTGKSLPLTKLGSFELGGDPRNFGGMATGADLSADGRFLAVLSYHAVFIFERSTSEGHWLSKPVNRIDLNQAKTQQVEAIAWVGNNLIFTNEQGFIFKIDGPLEKRETRFPSPGGTR